MPTETLTTTAPPAKLSAFVPASLRDDLERLARENYRTLSAEMRLAMARHVAQEAGKHANHGEAK